MTVDFNVFGALVEHGISINVKGGLTVIMKHNRLANWNMKIKE